MCGIKESEEKGKKVQNLKQKIRKSMLLSFALFLFMTGGYVAAAETADDAGIMSAKANGTNFRITISPAEGASTIKEIKNWESGKKTYKVGTGEGTVYTDKELSLAIQYKKNGGDDIGKKKISFDLKRLDGVGETTSHEVEMDPFITWLDGYYHFDYKITPFDGNALLEAKYQIVNLTFVEENADDSTVQTEDTDDSVNDQVVYIFDNRSPQINYTYENETTKPLIMSENANEEKCFYAGPFQGEVRISDMNLNVESVSLENAPEYAEAEITRLPSGENRAETKDAEGETENAESEVPEVIYQYAFSKEGSYRLTAEAEDRLGHKGTQDSKVMVLDATVPEVSVSVSKEDGTKIRSLEEKCFKENLTISVQASDAYLDRESLCLTITGWTADGESVAYTVQGDAWVQNEAGYGCKYQISENGAYRFEVSAKDFAGNSAETLPLENKTFYIDRTAPVVKIVYDDTEAKNEFYYQEERTATITVKDFTFEADEVEFLIDAQEEHSPVYGEWIHHKGENCDGEKHTASCSYTRDVTFDKEDIYDVAVRCRDRAGNASEKEGGHFVIDRTAPVIFITYDRNREDGSCFYNAARTASIVITDLSFDEDAVAFNKAQSNYSSIPQTDSWNNVGKKHTLPVVFDKDGIYQFTVSATDLAGNQAEILTSEYFVIDQTAPALSIKGIENLSAYNGEVRPEITYGDLYLDDSKTEISCIGVRSGEVALSCDKVPTAYGFSVQYPDFSYTEETDDLYVLTVNVQDTAGNISEQSMLFSVNRFGSVYVPSEETKQLLDNYYIDGREDLIINEINVDYLTTTEITSSHNGEIRTLVAGRDYLVTEEGTEGSWKTYRYVISDSNFAQDGYYVLTLSSTDKAQNPSDNRIKGTELSFAVDRTEPSLVVSGVRSHAVYRRDAVKITADVQDNMSMDVLSVYMDERLLCEFDGDTLRESGGVVSFPIEEADESRKLTLCARDTAGNISEKTYSDFTVSTKRVGHFTANPAVIVGLLVLAMFLFGGLYGRKAMYLKQRKRDE